MNTVVVAGFGSFGDVTNNPSAAIAVALDGCVLDGVAVVGREMPVSHNRSVGLCALLLARTRAVALIGIGVALDRQEVTVERYGRRPQSSTRLDVDHRAAPDSLVDGPDRVEASVDSERFAERLGVATSEDAGNYVCNSWLYQATQRFTVDVGFIHVPPLGMDSGTLLSAIASMWGGDGGR